MSKLKGALFVAASAFALASCGSPDGAGVSVSNTAAVMPELRFASPIISAIMPSGAALAIQQNSQVVLPCGAQYFRAKYKYVNSGTAAAGPHTNKSFGGGVYSFGQLPLAVGPVRTSWASFGPLAANVWTQIAIRLDGTFVVPELVEANNAWVAWVRRTCP